MITIPHRYSAVVNVASNSKSELKVAVISLPFSALFYRKASSSFITAPAYFIA
jgi:hypothetical protein